MTNLHSHGTLEIDLLDLWQAGSGRGEGHHLDSVPVLDADNLPFLPGRTIKGLLRDAVLHLESIQGFAPELLGASSSATPRGTIPITTWIFGTRDGKSGGAQTRFNSTAGKIWVSDARLSPAIRQRLTDRDQPSLRAALFHDVFATAIDGVTGQAKDQSLRSKRVCVPMVLHCDLEVDSDATLAIVEAALPLIEAIGTQRTRGLGRCIWTLDRNPSTAISRTRA